MADNYDWLTDEAKARYGITPTEPSVDPSSAPVAQDDYSSWLPEEARSKYGIEPVSFVDEGLLEQAKTDAKQAVEEDEPSILSKAEDWSVNASKLFTESASHLTGNLMSWTDLYNRDLLTPVGKQQEWLTEKFYNLNDAMNLGGVVWEGGDEGFRYVPQEEWDTKKERMRTGNVVRDIAKSLKEFKFQDSSKVDIEDIKDSAKEGEYGKVAKDTGNWMAQTNVESLPHMAVAIASLPAYALGLSDKMGQDRAAAMGEEHTFWHNLQALPFAVGAAWFERFGAEKVFGAGKEAAEEAAKQLTKDVIEKKGTEILWLATKEVAKAGRDEALTEFVQEGFFEYLGEKAFTGQDLDVGDMVERGAWGALAGGAGGAVLGGGAAGTRMATLNSQSNKARMNAMRHAHRAKKAVDDAGLHSLVDSVTAQLDANELDPFTAQTLMQYVEGNAQEIVEASPAIMEATGIAKAVVDGGLDPQSATEAVEALKAGMSQTSAQLVDAVYAMNLGSAATAAQTAAQEEEAVEAEEAETGPKTRVLEGTVAARDGTEGEAVTIYDADGNPLQATVEAVSEQGTIAVTMEDGTRELLDVGDYSANDVQSSAYPLEAVEVEGVETVGELSDDQLTAAVQSVEKQVADIADGAVPTESAAKRRQLAALKNEQARRTGGTDVEAGAATATIDQLLEGKTPAQARDAIESALDENAREIDAYRQREGSLPPDDHALIERRDDLLNAYDEAAAASERNEELMSRRSNPTTRTTNPQQQPKEKGETATAKVGMTVATDRIEDIKELLDEARAGNTEAAEEIREISRAALDEALEGMDVDTRTPSSTGLYFGDIEPSIGTQIDFEEKDHHKVVVALVEVARDFQQEQIHVRQPAEEGTDVGHEYGDGSFNTLTYNIELTADMSQADIQAALKESGLAGGTVTDGNIEAYYVGDFDEQSITDFKAGIARLTQSLGSSAGRIEQTTERLWIYGEGAGAIPYDQAGRPIQRAVRYTYSKAPALDPDAEITLDTRVDVDPVTTLAGDIYQGEQPEGTDPLLHETIDKYPLDENGLPTDPERRVLHESIVSAVLMGATPVVGRKPVAYLMLGGSASGKTTIINALKAVGAIPRDGVVHIDPDRVKTGYDSDRDEFSNDDDIGYDGLPEYWEVYDAGDSRAASVVHEESSHLKKQLTDIATDPAGLHSDILLDGTLSNLDSATKLIRKLKERGYEVKLYGATVSAETAVRRILERGKKSGRFVPMKHALGSHQGSSKVFDSVAPLVDEAWLFDTEVAKVGDGTSVPYVVASKLGTEERLQIDDKEVYDIFLGKVRLDAKSKTLREITASQGRDPESHRIPKREPTGSQSNQGERGTGPRTPLETQGYTRPSIRRGNQTQLHSRGAEPAVDPDGMTVDEVTKAISGIIMGIGGAVDIRVVQSESQVPDSATAGRFEGVWETGTSTVYLVANSLSGPRRAIEVATHEALGHLAMERIPEFKKALDSTKNLIKQVMDDMTPEEAEAYEAARQRANAAQKAYEDFINENGRPPRADSSIVKELTAAERAFSKLALTQIAGSGKAGNKGFRQALAQIAARPDFHHMSETVQAKEVIATMAEMRLRNGIMGRVKASLNKLLNRLGVTEDFNEETIVSLIQAAAVDLQAASNAVRAMQSADGYSVLTPVSSVVDILADTAWTPMPEDTRARLAEEAQRLESRMPLPEGAEERLDAIRRRLAAGDVSRVMAAVTNTRAQLEDSEDSVEESPLFSRLEGERREDRRSPHDVVGGALYSRFISPSATHLTASEVEAALERKVQSAATGEYRSYFGFMTDGDVSILVNPTMSELRRMRETSEYGELRYYQEPSTGDYWFWDAENAWHNPVIIGMVLTDDRYSHLSDEISGPYVFDGGIEVTGMLRDAWNEASDNIIYDINYDGEILVDATAGDPFTLDYQPATETAEEVAARFKTPAPRNYSYSRDITQSEMDEAILAEAKKRGLKLPKPMLPERQQAIKENDRYYWDDYVIMDGTYYEEEDWRDFRRENEDLSRELFPEWWQDFDERWNARHNQFKPNPDSKLYSRFVSPSVEADLTVNSVNRAIRERFPDVAERFDSTSEMDRVFRGLGYGYMSEQDPVSVMVNPTKGELIRYLETSDSGELRWYQEPQTGEFWFWDANRSWHGMVLAGMALNNPSKYSEMSESFEVEEDRPYVSFRKDTEAYREWMNASDNIIRQRNTDLDGPELVLGFRDTHRYRFPDGGTAGFKKPAPRDYSYSRMAQDSELLQKARDEGRALPAPMSQTRQKAIEENDQYYWDDYKIVDGMYYEEEDWEAFKDANEDLWKEPEQPKSPMAERFRLMELQRNRRSGADYKPKAGHRFSPYDYEQFREMKGSQPWTKELVEKYLGPDAKPAEIADMTRVYDAEFIEKLSPTPLSEDEVVQFEGFNYSRAQVASLPNGTPVLKNPSREELRFMLQMVEGTVRKGEPSVRFAVDNDGNFHFFDSAYSHREMAAVVEDPNAFMRPDPKKKPIPSGRGKPYEEFNRQLFYMRRNSGTRAAMEKFVTLDDLKNDNVLENTKSGLEYAPNLKAAESAASPTPAYKTPAPRDYRFSRPTVSTVDEFVDTTMTQLNRTSRTLAGKVDATGQKGKFRALVRMKGDKAAKLADANMKRVLRKLWSDRDKQFTGPDELLAYFDEIAAEVSRGILKDGHLLRESEGKAEYRYAGVDEIPQIRATLAGTVLTMMDDPEVDPVDTAAYLKWTMDHDGHIYADGVGKTSTALASWILAREGIAPPNLPYFKDYIAKVDEAKSGPAPYPEFRSYYKSLVRSRNYSKQNYYDFDAPETAIADAEYSRDELTESPSFMQWFEGSKIADGYGRPIVLYRGSKGGSNNPNSLGVKTFTSGFGTATQYAENDIATYLQEWRGDRDPKIGAYAVNVQNPFAPTEEDISAVPIPVRRHVGLDDLEAALASGEELGSDRVVARRIERKFYKQYLREIADYWTDVMIKLSPAEPTVAEKRRARLLVHRGVSDKPFVALPPSPYVAVFIFDSELVAKAAQILGYDGAVYHDQGGWRSHGDATGLFHEVRPFDSSQIMRIDDAGKGYYGEELDNYQKPMRYSRGVISGWGNDNATGDPAEDAAWMEQVRASKQQQQDDAARLKRLRQEGRSGVPISTNHIAESSGMGRGHHWVVDRSGTTHGYIVEDPTTQGYIAYRLDGTEMARGSSMEGVGDGFTTNSQYVDPRSEPRAPMELPKMYDSMYSRPSYKEAYSMFWEDNPNFKKWFKGSKAVSDGGTPIRLYRGASGLEGLGRGEDGAGISLTDSPTAAATYAVQDMPNPFNPSHSVGNHRTGAWYARVTKPLVLTKRMFYNKDSFIAAVTKQADSKKVARQVMAALNWRSLGERGDDLISNQSYGFSIINMPVVVAALKELGFDGVRLLSTPTTVSEPSKMVAVRDIAQKEMTEQFGKTSFRGASGEPVMEEWRVFEESQLSSAISPSVGYRGDKVYSRPSADPEIESMLKRLMATPQEDLTALDRIREYVNRLGAFNLLGVRQGIIDSAASWEAWERGQSMDGNLLDASISPYKAIAATKNLNGVMAAIMLKGVPVYKDGSFQMVRGRKGIAEIFSQLTESQWGNLMAEWELYAAARRANQLIKQKNKDGTSREKLFTQKDIDRALANAQKYKLDDGTLLFESVFDEWRRFNRQVLQMAAQAGVLDSEAAKEWAKNDYVPFYRAVEEAAGEVQGPKAAGTRAGVSDVNANQKRLWGSEKPLGNIFENMITNVAYLVDASYRNTAMQRVVDLAEGSVMTKVPMAVQALKVSDDQIARGMMAAGMLHDKSGRKVTDAKVALSMVREMGADQKEYWVTLFRRVKPVGKNIVSVLVDGKPQYYEVNDPLMLRTLQGMGPQQFTGVMKWFVGGKRLLTGAVTIEPSFMIANFLRDTLSNYIQTDMGKLPAQGTLGGFAEAMKEDEDMLALMMAGAGGGGHYDMNPRGVRKLLAKKMPKAKVEPFMKTIIGAPVKGSLSLLEAYRKIGSASEQANRIAVYRRVLEKGGTVAEAAYQARDVLNFTRQGDYGAMMTLVAVVPFLNARIQGLDRLQRGVRQQGDINFMGVAMKGFVYVAASLALAYHNEDEERYQNLPDWDKDTYWHFFIGDEHYRLPKPFEVGALFGTVPERMYRTMTGQDDMKLFAERIGAMFSETFAFNPVPQLVRPIAEQYMNKSFFTGNPLVGYAEQRRQEEEQYNAFTSETAIALADAMPDAAPAWLRSPMRLEAAVRGYTSQTGMYVLKVADAMTRAVTDAPAKPEKDIRDFPVLARFWRSQNPRTNRWVSEMYEMSNEVDALYNSIEHYKKTMQGEKAQELLAEEGAKAKLGARRALNDMKRDISKINKKIQQVMNDRSMTAAQKRKEIDKLNELRLERATQAAGFAELF